MKKQVEWAARLMVWAAISGCLSSSALAQQGQGYFWGEAGPSWSEDADLDEFADQPVAGAELDFNTGIRFTVGAGYHVTDWFAAEFETGVIYNSVDSVNLPWSGKASVSQVPFLANAVFSLPNRSHFVPYAGGGVGGVLSILNADYFEIAAQPPATGADGNFSDFVFAYQGFAGVRYEFNENMSLGLTYRYLAAEDVRWRPEVSIGTSGSIRAGPFRHQSVGLAFTFLF